MPYGNGTGPLGLGPMTGRRAGYCAGYFAPGYANPIPGRGRAGYGRGLGRGFGRGRGRGFGRGFGFGWGAYPYAMPASPANLTPKEEADMLKEEAKSLQEEVDAINRRIKDLESREAQTGNA